MILPDTDKRIALIIRHAERFEFDRMSNALEALLTESGKREAFLLGARISPFSPFKINYSPVKRCQETAENIQLGLLSKNSLSQIEGSIFNLGGPYIKGDWHAIADMVENIGQSVFIRKWFNNEISDSLIAPIESSAHTQMKILVDQLLYSDYSVINITHDWNIMILREYFLNLKHEEIGQPGFLDGLCAYIHEDSIILSSMKTKKSFHLNAILQIHNQ